MLYRRDAEAATARLLDRVGKAGSAPAALEAWIDEILSFRFDRRKAERVALLGAASARRAEGYAAESAQSARMLSAPLIEVLEQGLRDGSFPDAEPRPHAEMIRAIVFDLAGLNSSGRGPVPAATATHDVLRFCLRALGAESGERPIFTNHRVTLKTKAAGQMETKIWTNSGDSHSIEPPNLYRDNMPAAYSERMPRSEFVDGEIITYIDGKVIKRRAPGGANLQMMEAMRAQGGTDNSKRMDDLDEQGVWGEVVFPSLGLWYGEIESPDLAAAAAEVLNDWVADEILALAPNRLVPCATLPLQSIELSVAEVERCAARASSRSSCRRSRR